MPIAAIMAVFLVVPGMRLVRWLIDKREQQRLERRLCPACGYDTRANPAKCSECGHETIESRGLV